MIGGHQETGEVFRAEAVAMDTSAESVIQYSGCPRVSLGATTTDLYLLCGGRLMQYGLKGKFV